MNIMLLLTIIAIGSIIMFKHKKGKKSSLLDKGLVLLHVEGVVHRVLTSPPLWSFCQLEGMVQHVEEFIVH